MPELYQLRELAAFGEAGTISKAAEIIGISQPAMSRSMKLLEEEIGVPLFIRTSNTIMLNETGKKAVEYAKSITKEVQNAVEAIRAFDRQGKTILVGSEAPAPLWAVISMLSNTYIDKTIAGELKSRKILEEGLSSGTYRYIITMQPVRLTGFSTFRLGEEKLMFLLPDSHPLAKRRTLSFSDMDGENMLLYEHIGSWKGLPEKMLPHSKFFIQSDRLAFEELVRKSSLPSFASDLTDIEEDGKAAIPISDDEAKAEFFISARTADQNTLTMLAKHFRENFRKGRTAI